MGIDLYRNQKLILQELTETSVGLEGMKIDRELFQQFKDTVVNDEEIKEMKSSLAAIEKENQQIDNVKQLLRRITYICYHYKQKEQCKMSTVKFISQLKSMIP